MKLAHLLVAVLALILAPALSADALFHVKWGKAAGEIGFYNSATPGFDQPYSEGPGGLALGPSSEVWISDQWNDRLLVYSRDGRFLRAVDQIGGQKITRPKALYMDGKNELIVVNGQSNALTRFDIAANTATPIGGGSAAGPGSLRQPELLGISSDKVCVQDDWKSELVCFARNGSVTRMPWVLGGLGVDKDGAVYTVEFRSQGAFSSNVLVSTAAGGARTDRFTLTPPPGESTPLIEPQLVGLDAAGGAVVRFTKKGTRSFALVHYDAEGKSPRTLGQLPINVTRQAYVVTPEGGVVALAFDANTAPKGTVDVVEMR